MAVSVSVSVHLCNIDRHELCLPHPAFAPANTKNALRLRVVGPPVQRQRQRVRAANCQLSTIKRVMQGSLLPMAIASGGTGIWLLLCPRVAL